MSNVKLYIYKGRYTLRQYTQYTLRYRQNYNIYIFHFPAKCPMLFIML